eukprot:CAMPEP_0185042576 /NCGR_PEP_ID=MMETSP1103-20130426/42433_1 /TAXON_ID=36769 /ORGANISM="Paraphysomonas bandaiensis, Strain Caron Lab Isolate" /LENGTH=185 /DNA_ID=CAMNT_0027582671 /DNA_START=179 /DNA_END=734 /DNA_ORIENTATION=-
MTPPGNVTNVGVASVRRVSGQRQNASRPIVLTIARRHVEAKIEMEAGVGRAAPSFDQWQSTIKLNDNDSSSTPALPDSRNSEFIRGNVGKGDSVAPSFHEWQKSIQPQPVVESKPSVRQDVCTRIGKMEAGVGRAAPSFDQWQSTIKLNDNDSSSTPALPDSRNSEFIRGNVGKGDSVAPSFHEW